MEVTVCTVSNTSIKQKEKKDTQREREREREREWERIVHQDRSKP